MATEEVEADLFVAITAYGSPLMEVSSFKYMGRFLSASDDDWPELIPNLGRAR